jgi:phosphate starvation-inducible PhoH-like protein
MIERIVIIDQADPVSFYGVNNANMQLIRNLFPKLRMGARGSVIKVIGDEAETAEFEKKIKELEQYCAKYNKLTEEVILDVIKGDTPHEMKADDVIIYGVNGKPISARTPNQQKLVNTFLHNDLTFALGPAGTGKTYVAIALAVRALKNREVKKIILSRPAVEAGEKLGFLPGDMKDKIDPYLQPLYDALEDMIPAVKLKEYMETNVIQIAPLAFMRGRTLNDAVIVLDEAQNTTTHQIKMFLTRMGMNAKMIITGDVTQIDLPRSTPSGLIQALRILHDINGIGRIEFGKKDIVRHPLVQRIVEAYARADEEAKAAANDTPARRDYSWPEPKVEHKNYNEQF